MPSDEITVEYAGVKELSKGFNANVKDTSDQWYSAWCATRNQAETILSENGIVKGAVGVITYDVKGNFKNMTNFEPTSPGQPVREEKVVCDCGDCSECLKRREAELAKSGMADQAKKDSREADIKVMGECLKDAMKAFSLAFPTFLAKDHMAEVQDISACFWITRQRRGGR
jgi:hypothetical protein